MSTLMFTNLNVVMVCCKKGKETVTIQKHHAECLQSFIVMAYNHYNKIQSSLQSLHSKIQIVSKYFVYITCNILHTYALYMYIMNV